MQTTTLQPIPEVAALVAALAPASLRIVSHTPVVGEATVRWAIGSERRDELQCAYEAAITRAAGFSFADAANNAERRAWIAVGEGFLDINETLNARFGDPEYLSARWGIRDIGKLNEIWQAECARAEAMAA